MNTTDKVKIALLCKRSLVSKIEMREQIILGLKDFPKTKITICKPSRRRKLR